MPLYFRLIIILFATIPEDVAPVELPNEPSNIAKIKIVVTFLILVEVVRIDFPKYRTEGGPSGHGADNDVTGPIFLRQGERDGKIKRFAVRDAVIQWWRVSGD